MDCGGGFGERFCFFVEIGGEAFKGLFARRVGDVVSCVPFISKGAGDFLHIRAGF